MTNPWLARRVLHFAHQGGAREAPASTLFAMRRALAAGADVLELDVHATADGHLVVCHDDTVDRTTEGTGRIATLTLEEIQALDNAYWWVPGGLADRGAPQDAYVLRGLARADPELRIPTLRRVLEVFPEVFLNLDIKQTSPQVTPYEASLAALLRQFGRADDVIVASFWDHALEAFSAHAPEVSTSMGQAAAQAFWLAVRSRDRAPSTRHQALQVPCRVGTTTVVDPGLVARAHAAGLAVHVWTVDEPEEMGELCEMGVDGIMTDLPSVLGAMLRTRRLAYRN